MFLKRLPQFRADVRIALTLHRQDACVVLYGCVQARMFVVGAAGEIENNTQCPAHQRLGFSEAVDVLKQLGSVDEGERAKR